MPRFSVKDMLRGLTLAAVGFGMLAIVFNRSTPPESKELKLLDAFLVGFGGMFVGYGFAFPFKWPPHQMAMAGIGMFAAQAWQSGHSFGLILYIGLQAVLVIVYLVKNRADQRPNSESDAEQ